jgi:preprotein translocase subunit Sss1
LKTSLSRCAWAPSRRALMIYTALASMIAIAIRPLVVSVANVEVKVGLSTERVPRASRRPQRDEYGQSVPKPRAP